MKTKQRVLLALLAAAVLLCAALWAVTRSNAKAEQAASAAAEGSIPLSTFAAEDLEQIEYTYNGETYTLQYSGGSWQLAQDPAYHLDESACNTMRTALMATSCQAQPDTAGGGRLRSGQPAAYCYGNGGRAEHHPDLRGRKPGHRGSLCAKSRGRCHLYRQRQQSRLLPAG